MKNPVNFETGYLYTMLQSFYTKDKIEAGTDEVGRGCLAGPVFAAAVILKKDFEHPILRDSKKLSLQQRISLAAYIKENALSYGIKRIDPVTIDQINILNASIKAMHGALSKLSIVPEFILVDGNKFKPYRKIPFQCVIKGDDKFYAIAAASVLAKVARDEYMVRQAEKYPQYHWHTNVGYPTKAHRQAIEIHGITALHRKSFKLTEQQLSFDF